MTDNNDGDTLSHGAGASYEERGASVPFRLTEGAVVNDAGKLVQAPMPKVGPTGPAPSSDAND
jgi:hypothetical protein